MARNMSPSIQPVAWRINVHKLPDALRIVEALCMPEVMFGSLVGLKPSASKVPPFASLHDLLGTFSSLILGFEPAFLRPENTRRAWLYTTTSDQIDKKRLRTLIHHWLTASYGSERAAALARSWMTLDWSHTRIDLANASIEMQKRLLASLVTRWLLTQPYQFTLEGKMGTQAMPLRLVPLMSSRQHAELMTEPQELRGMLVSFVLRFWVETMPVTGELVLYQKTSVRRWMQGSLISDNRVRLKWNRNRCVYLRRHTGYLDRQPRQDVFSRISMRFDGGGAQGLHWVGNQANVFGQEGIGEAFPTPLDFAQDLNAHRNQLLIAMEARDAQNSRVSAGLNIRDYLDIMRDLAKVLAVIVDSLPHQLRYGHGDPRRMISQSQRERKRVSAETRYAALQAMPHTLRIELQTPHVREAKHAILKAVGYEIAVEELDDGSQTVTDERGRTLLEIIPYYNAEILDLLPPAAEKANWQARQAIEAARQRQISQRYARLKQPTGVLVLLPDYRSTLRNRDPKQAIRAGFTQAGRISKFYTPRKEKESPEGLTHRLQNSVMALLRILGYRYNPYYMPPPDIHLPPELDLIVFWLFQRNARHRKDQTVLLPLMAVVPAGSCQIEVYLPSSTGTAQHYPSLSQALIAASTMEMDFEQPAQAVNFFRSAMSRRKSQTPTLLFLCEQNIRRVFPELSSQKPGKLSLGGILDAAPYIRVAQLRFSRDEEAPFCLPGAKHGKYQGLYGHEDQPHVFYSLHNINPALVKPSIMHRKLDMTSRLALNPSTVQVWLRQLHADDVPAEWAALVHRLRLESSHTDTATVYPQPIHDVQILHDYLTRLVDEVDDEDTND